jgi:hypothetical protein
MSLPLPAYASPSHQNSTGSETTAIIILPNANPLKANFTRSPLKFHRGILLPILQNAIDFNNNSALDDSGARRTMMLIEITHYIGCQEF